MWWSLCTFVARLHFPCKQPCKKNFDACPEARRCIDRNVFAWIVMAGLGWHRRNVLRKCICRHCTHINFKRNVVFIFIAMRRWMQPSKGFPEVNDMGKGWVGRFLWSRMVILCATYLRVILFRFTRPCDIQGSFLSTLGATQVNNTRTAS